MVGYGRATKTQMQEMVTRLLNLSGQPGSDAADALGMAICHAHGGDTLSTQTVYQGTWTWDNGSRTLTAPRGVTYTHQLDATGKHVAQRQISAAPGPDVKPALGGPHIQSWEFNARGQIAKSTDAHGISIRYLYQMANEKIVCGPERFDPDQAITFENNLGMGVMVERHVDGRDALEEAKATHGEARDAGYSKSFQAAE